MKKSTLILGALALVLGGIVVISADNVYAYRGDTETIGPYYSTERHAEMTEAFENLDYNAWKNLMQDKGRVTQVITEENFAQFAEVHQLTLENRGAEAKKLRQELGLGLQDGSGRGEGRMVGRNRGISNGFNR